MLTRRREQVVLILGLIALNIVFGWRLVVLWREYRSSTRWIYGSAPPAVPAAIATDQGKAAPQSFSDIVDHNLFSPLRTNQPPQPKEEAKAPELPLLFGTMNLGNGWFALMAAGGEKTTASKRVLPGEEIGGYKLVSIGTSQVVLDWQEKKFTVDVSESARRVPRIVERTAEATAPANPPGAQPAPVTTVASHTTQAAPLISASPPSNGLKPAASWSPSGAPADAPEGTIVDGRRKVLVPTPWGVQVQWQLVTPPASQAPSSSPPQ